MFPDSNERLSKGGTSSNRGALGATASVNKSRCGSDSASDRAESGIVPGEDTNMLCALHGVGGEYLSSPVSDRR